MHSSFFNYSITRAYPYRWFTPVAAFGGIILLVLFSLMNFVQNGYSLTVTYSNDPNSTITENVWFKHWPSYFTNTVQPSCEPANLPVNSQFFTNQSGLMWTITSIFKDEENSTALPSVPYMNNKFERCTVVEISMDFDGTQDREVAAAELTPWDTEVRALVTCSIWSPIGWTSLNLTAMYDPIQSYQVGGSTTLVSRDPKSRASMYWSEALLSAYWVATANRLDEVALTIAPPTFVKGFALLSPSQTELDITSLSFFDLSFNFLLEKESYGFGLHGPQESMKTYIEHSIFDLAPQPQIWLQVDSLAKAMYSAVLSDLGQTATPVGSNIVTNATILQYFSSNITTIPRTNVLYYNQIETQSYEQRQSSQDPTGPLGLTPSVASTSYLCQVPQRKAIGDIFISVLLADLVFLQAAWKLYTFIVDLLFLRKDKTADHCEGCIVDEGAELEMLHSNITPTRQQLKSVSLVSSVAISKDGDGVLGRENDEKKWSLFGLRR